MMKHLHWYDNGTGWFDCAGAVTRAEGAEIMRLSPHGTDIVLRVGVDPNAPRRVTVGTRDTRQPNGWTSVNDRLMFYATRLSHNDAQFLADRMAAGDRFAVFHLDGETVTLAEVEPAGMVVA